MGRLHLMTFWASCEIWRARLWQSNRDRFVLWISGAFLCITRCRKSLDHYSKIINNLDVIPLAAWMTGHATCFSHVAFALRGHTLWVCPSELLILYKNSILNAVVYFLVMILVGALLAMVWSASLLDSFTWEVILPKHNAFTRSSSANYLLSFSQGKGTVLSFIIATIWQIM